MSSPEELLAAGRKKNLSQRQWSEIVNLARNGMSQTEISRIYKVSPSTINRGLQNRNIRVGELLEEARRKEELRERDQLVSDIKKAKRSAVDRIEFVENQALLLFKKAQDEKKSIGDYLDDLKALKLSGDIIARGQDVKHRALGIDKENKDADAATPELVVRRMTDAEVRLIRDKQQEGDGEISEADLKWIEEQTNREIDGELDGEGNPEDIIEVEE